MGKQREKYLNKIDSKQRWIVIDTVSKIYLWEFQWLDISKLEWKSNRRRYRIWKLRIVFKKVGIYYEIVRISPRWDVYKK